MDFVLPLAPEVFDPDAIAAHFAGRANYRVDARQAAYENPDTGVRFTFDIGAPDGAGGAEGAGRDGPRVAFTLACRRSHVFGLEAEPEIAAFVSAFRCRIRDPRAGGMAAGTYSRDGFLESWNRRNAANVLSDDSDGAVEAMKIPGARIEQVWVWNRARNDRQAEHNSRGQGLFAPRISWARDPVSRDPILYCVWGEGVQAEFPALATHILLARDARRPKGFLQSLVRKPEARSAEYRLMRLEEAAEIDGASWGEVASGRVLATPAVGKASGAVRALFNDAFGGLDGKLDPVAADAVLDAELFPGGSQNP